MRYDHTLRTVAAPPPILAQYPEYVAPLAADRRLQGAPLVDDVKGTLLVRSWRYWYNARAIVQFDNVLDGQATAIIVVHPWGVDDGAGLPTPQPAGVAFFCTPEKNAIALAHMRDVVAPLLSRLGPWVLTRACSLTGQDAARPNDARIAAHDFSGQALPQVLELDPQLPVASYFAAAHGTDAGPAYNGAGYWDLPMPLAAPLANCGFDCVYYDGNGYDQVRDDLKRRGVRHILLCGYATDMCVARTTCGYENLSRDFNLFIVGDATLATFPASRTPAPATLAALTSASLAQMITEVGWIAPVRPAKKERG